LNLHCYKSLLPAERPRAQVYIPDFPALNMHLMACPTTGRETPPTCKEDLREWLPRGGRELYLEPAGRPGPEVPAVAGLHGQLRCWLSCAGQGRPSAAAFSSTVRPRTIWPAERRDGSQQEGVDLGVLRGLAWLQAHLPSVKTLSFKKVKQLLGKAIRLIRMQLPIFCRAMQQLIFLNTMFKYGFVCFPDMLFAYATQLNT